MTDITIDFVARETDGSRFSMVLVEEGPWESVSVEAELRRVQSRLYGCLDAAIDGQLAEKFPESRGKPVTIRVDFYNVPEVPVREFFQRFSSGVLDAPSYREALATTEFVRGVSFEASFERIASG
jgi:hypothetical protein